MSSDLRLTSFEPAHAATVLGWVGSPEELDRWTSRSDFPPGPEVFGAWHADPDVVPFVLLEDGAVAAYGGIWEDAAEDEAELARIIVACGRRGRGVGRRFVRLLAGEALRRGFGEVWLRVVPTNGPALACYRSAGFRRADADMEQGLNRGQARDYAWMRLSRTGTE